LLVSDFTCNPIRDLVPVVVRLASSAKLVLLSSNLIESLDSALNVIRFVVVYSSAKLVPSSLNLHEL
jgi:hypothetical protein